MVGATPIPDGLAAAVAPTARFAADADTADSDGAVGGGAAAGLAVEAGVGAPASGWPVEASTTRPSKGPARSPGSTVSGRAGKGASAITGPQPDPKRKRDTRNDAAQMAVASLILWWRLDIFMIRFGAASRF